MKLRLPAVLCFVGVCAFADPVVYSNLAVTNAMAVRSGSGVEAGDDFVLTNSTLLTRATFVGLFTGASAADISSVTFEVFRVYPLDSNTGLTPNVPTRTNTPGDTVFASGGGTFTSTVLNGSFTSLNSVDAGGIHMKPNQTTGGNGSVSGSEIQIDLTFTTPLSLGPDHYYIVPVVTLSNGGKFYWLSATRPITGSGSTPFSPDLQSVVRDSGLAPDWLRVGTDIVGSGTFNMAFALYGTQNSNTVPEPSTALLLGAGLAVAAVRKRYGR